MIAPRQILFKDLSDAGKNVLRQLLAALLRQMDQVNEVFMRTVQMGVGIHEANARVLLRQLLDE